MVCKSFGRLVSLFIGAFVSAVCLCFFRSGLTCVFSVCLSLGPQGGHPRAPLKASTSQEAPTLALTTKAPVPTTANRRSTRTEATRRTLTFKTVVKRADCAALEGPYQHRGDVSPEQPSWSLGTALLRFNAVTLSRTVGLQDYSGETCSLSEDQQLRRQ